MSIFTTSMDLRSDGGTSERLTPEVPASTRKGSMSRKAPRDLIVGLDIGTSKVVAIVGGSTPDGRLEVVGLGSHPSRGMNKGVVVNIEATTQSIRRAVEEAELMAGCRIQSVYAGISGAHVKSFNSQGIVGVSHGEVSPHDVERVIAAARARRSRRTRRCCTWCRRNSSSTARRASP